MQLELHRPSENSPVRISRRDFRIMSFLRRNAIDLEPVKSSRIASAIAIKGNIVSLGYCSKRTHPFQKRFAKNPDAIYLHAETNAIRNSLNHMPPGDLQQATLYINRQKHPPHDNKAWVDGLAKPCAGCERAIIEFGLKRVVYTTEITNEYEVLTAK
jgi:deoxycytidylate deaminase